VNVPCLEFGQPKAEKKMHLIMTIDLRDWSQTPKKIRIFYECAQILILFVPIIFFLLNGKAGGGSQKKYDGCANKGGNTLNRNIDFPLFFVFRVSFFSMKGKTLENLFCTRIKTVCLFFLHKKNRIFLSETRRFFFA